VDAPALEPRSMRDEEGLHAEAEKGGITLSTRNRWAALAMEARRGGR
jgi:hypothetical protein